MSHEPTGHWTQGDYVPETLDFDVHGDVDAMQWNPSDWTYAESEDEFRQELCEAAEEQSTWGVHLVGVRVGDLWLQVQQAKKLQDSDAGSRD